MQNVTSDYETQFNYRDTNEVSPYSLPQDLICKSRSKFASKDYESPMEYTYASSAVSLCACPNSTRVTITNDDMRTADYSEVLDKDGDSTNDEEEAYFDPGRSELDVYACFEKKRFRMIKTNDIRYVCIIFILLINWYKL